MSEKMTTLSKLTAAVRDFERLLAPGSETALWADYCESMRKLTGQLPYDDSDTDPEVPVSEALWWVDRYVDLEHESEDAKPSDRERWS